MTAPAVVIRLELEAVPLLYADFTTDAEENRLRHWLDAHPPYAELIERAVELAEEEQAA